MNWRVDVTDPGYSGAGGRYRAEHFETKHEAEVYAQQQRMKGYHARIKKATALAKRLANRKKNPARLTKTQRKARTKKLSAKRRVANALKAYLQKANPGRKLAGAKVQKNKGSITIVPVFLKKRK